MTVHIENPKEPTEKFHDLISKLAKGQDTRPIYKKQLYFYKQQ